MKPASAEMGVKIVRFQDRMELKSGEQMKFIDLFFTESQLRLIMNMFLSIECIWSFLRQDRKLLSQWFHQRDVFLFTIQHDQ